MAADRQLPVLFHLRSSSKFIVFSIVTAVFTDIILYGLLVPVFPFALTERANIPPEYLQRWISALLGIFGLGTCLGSVVFGYLADKYSNRRTPLLFGLCTLSITTLLLWFGRTISLLVVARFLQGITGGIVWSVGVALIVDTTSGDKGGSAAALGTVATAMSVGFLIGPSFGGLIYDKGGYNAVFACSISLIIIDIILRIMIIEKKEAVKYLSKDDPSQPLLQDATPSSSSSSSARTTDIDVTPSKIKSPFLVLIKSPRIIQCLMTNIIQAMVLTSLESTLPLHLHHIFGYNSTKVGLMFALLVAFNLLSPIFGRLCTRFGVKVLVTLGLLLAGLPLILLRLPREPTSHDQALMGVLLVIIGLGDALSLTPNMLEIEMSVSDIEKENPGSFGAGGGVGLAYGFHNFAFAFGSTIGPIFGGFMIEKYTWTAYTLTLGILSLGAAIPAVFLASGKQRQDNGEMDET